MRIQLSEHFNYRKLIRFVVPSIIMMIFTSVYGVVDGLGLMIGTGGSAIIAKTLGEGDREKANRCFSMLVYITIAGGVLLTLAGLLWVRPIAEALGAEGAMVEECVRYGRIILLAGTAFMLQNTFQSFLVTAEKPHLGLAVTIAAGLTNILFDALFVAVFRWGTVGAAAATAMSQVVGGILPLLYYHYGAENENELKNLFRKSLILAGLAGLAMTALAELLSLPLSSIFVGYDAELLTLTCHGFRLNSLSFLVIGFNIFASAFFTALNNGVVSAVISFLRTLVFQIIVVLVLPVFIGVDGIWLSIVVAELLALAVSIWFFLGQRGRYRYA